MYGTKPLPPYEEFIDKIKVFYTIVDECKRIAKGVLINKNEYLFVNK